MTECWEDDTFGD